MMNNEINETGILPTLEATSAALIKADDSLFEFVIVAAQRCKQLSNGAPSRIPENVFKRKNTSIALEEVRNGLISFTTTEIAKP